jgi:hypothetical protein
VKDWRDILLAFRVKVDKKYRTSLGFGGSGNWVKDASKRVAWLRERGHSGLEKEVGLDERYHYYVDTYRNRVGCHNLAYGEC